ncbi:GATA zinc finger domain-containing protein 14-like [Cataglyphis hispanica]|uniref:GATA zinc finger domain-containing protein 14-like n=1 Tax=Cataglyphis hispanica TaxID=1086592 RepID=UPI00217F47F9|nr:GATA zinc finger domain-containing protein 14-like [Cataglyphis hispanica]XP_050462711.1 GATA zinc finger domain-containing protein 14-like [Cataglyphis hispanica]
MMSTDKRKIFASDTSDEDDSFKRRRSSLRVNLSYCENLTDSGNGSLWRTEIEIDGKDTAQSNKRLSRSKRHDIYEKKNHQLDSDNEEDLQVKSDMNKLVVSKNTNVSPCVKKRIQLKELRVNLEDINIKEKALEANCKRLKDAILNKTKEIFDRENEFSKKTAMILKNEENHCVDDVHIANIENKSIIILDTMTNHQLIRNKTIMKHEKYTNSVNNQQRDNQYSNIVTTPTSSKKLESFSKGDIDKSRLTQRRLFDKEDKQKEGQAKCRIIEDIVLKEKFPFVSLRQTVQSDSPILSGSNRRLGLLRKSKLHSQSQSENHNTTYSTIHSQCVDIGAPIVCSTFNEDIVTSENENNNPYNEANNDVDTFRATHTTNNINMSMEMTEIHGGIRMSEMHLQSTNLNTINSIKNSEKKEAKQKSLEQNKCVIQMQKTENINSLVDKTTTQNNIAHFDLSSTNVANDQNTIVPVEANIEEAIVVIKTRSHIDERDNKIKNHNKKRRTLSLSDSNNTIRSSLNVNTSLDAVTEADKEVNVQKTSDYRFINSNQNFKTLKTNNEESVALDNQYESSNITEASMKMNTSVNSMRETWQRRSNHLQSLISNKNDEDTTENHPNMNSQHSLPAENKEANDDLENISLIQRLKNISTQNPIPYNNTLRISEMKEKVRMDNRSNDVKIQCTEHTSGDSYVEGTPYPISRSVLFKTQLRHKTQNLDNSITSCSNLNSMGNKENIDNTKSNALYSETVEIDAVILEDISSGNPDIQNQLKILQNKVNEIRFETSEKNKVTTDNMECISVKKKRLFPLNENSELCSISPIEEDKCIIEKSINPTKKNKKLRKKRPKRKSMDFKNDTSSIKPNIVREQIWSNNDYDISKNRKKKDKKIQKPRKVISKKIVIKKFADENVLNILKGNRQDKKDESIENRDSFDDFVKHRTIPTQWNKYKSQQIVIATTGLSKGDKSLVKSIVKSLGMAKIELNISRRTTHVVSTGVRTVNLLRGIIRGCWLVTLEWVLKSLENNGWLDPEEFEMKHFSKAVQENRKDRQLFGPSYIPELFATCGLIYVGPKTTVPCHTLKELIKTAGGHITENIKLAKIIIGKNGLKETWIIDCITTGELQLTNLYERK